MSEEITLREHLQSIASAGGSARTEKQRRARMKNIAKARAAKLRKRFGTIPQNGISSSLITTP